MSAEAWVGLAGTALTILAIVYYAGKIVSQMEGFGKGLFSLRTDFQNHPIENDKAHALLFEKTNRNEVELARHSNCAEYRQHRHGAAGE